MPADNQKFNQPIIAAVIVYYIMLLLYLLVSFNPDSRLWGLNWWGYFPIWVPLALFLIGLVIPVILYKYLNLNQTEKIDVDDQAESKNKYIYITSVMVICISLSYYFLRVKTHFLGDGYGLLTMLGTNMASYHQLREYGESLIHLWVYNILKTPGEYGALLSYRIISIAAGIAFLFTLVIAARKLYSETKVQILFIISLISGGYLLLFFGYVENYSLLLWSVTLFTLTGLLIVNSIINRWYILPVYILSIFFHVIGIVLFPAVVYLLLQNSKIGSRISKLKPLSWFLILLVVGSLASIVFYYFYNNYYFFRFSFVPLFENRFTVESYTLFSFNHILDFINLIFLLIPGIIVFIIWMIISKSVNFIRNKDNVFLVILSISVLGVAFIIDPKLGMPRDWDLFAFAGIPLMALIFNSILNSKIDIKSKLITIILMIALNLLCLIPRVTSQVLPEISLAHFYNYIKLDKSKNRGVSGFLYSYYLSVGETKQAKELNSLWRVRYPEIIILENATTLKSQRKYGDALKLYNSLIKSDPFHFDIYNNMSECYIETRQFDSAEVLLDIARGMSPYNPAVWSNIGWVNFYLKKYENAKNAWFKSMKFDSTNIQPYVGLISLYHSTKNELKYNEYLIITAQKSNAPGEVHMAFGNLLTKQGKVDDAVREYDKALAKGVNPLKIEQLKQRALKLKK